MYNLTTEASRPTPIPQPGLVEPGLMHADENHLSGIPQLATMVLSFSSHLTHLARDVDAVADESSTGAGISAVIESVDSIAVQTQFLSDFAAAIATRIQTGRPVAGLKSRV